MGNTAKYFKDIIKLDNGAQFVNADLHVHSYNASADVKDPTMTVRAIIDSALSQGITLLAITDHNSDKNVQEAIDYSQGFAEQILVLPGAEITTAHGHLLVYFSPLEAGKLQKLLAKIDIRGELGSQNSHTSMSMADVIAEAERLGGISIAAHIDRQKTGFEMLAEGYPNWKKDILSSSGLYAVEIDDTSHLNWYSPEDDSTQQGSERKKILEARAEIPGLAGRPRLAQIQGSDAHSMKAFCVSNPAKPWTRFKLNELSFEAFRTALIDPEARVRARASIPLSVPRIRGIHFSGGFLSGETIHFSDNLNCFIGGRGTGKSTAIRTLGYCLGVNEEFCDYDNCADNVTVWCEDADGVIYRYNRPRNGDIVVQAKEDGAITDVPIDAFRVDYYGQGMLADVAKDPLNNPTVFQQLYLVTEALAAPL